MDLDTLRRIESLASLPRRRLIQASRRLIWRRYIPGELILPHKAPLHLNGLVYRGRVQVATVRQGRRRTVGYVQAGQPINNGLWISRGLPIELRAVEATILCIVPPAGKQPTALPELPPDSLQPATFAGLLPCGTKTITSPRCSSQSAIHFTKAVPSAASSTNRTALTILLLAIVFLLGFTASNWQSIWRIPLSRAAYGLASQWLAAGESEKALSFLQASVNLNPHLASAYNDIGYIMYQQGQPEEAKSAFRQAVLADPTSAVAQSNLGLSYLEDRQVDLAREALQQAVTLNPESAAAWTNLGVAEQQSGHAEEAIRAYRAALRLNPHNTVAQTNLGVLCFEQELFTEAQDYLETALETQPNLTRAKLILGAIALSKGDLTRAWNELQAAAADSADDPLLHFYLALWYEESGARETAGRELERVLELQPNPDLVNLTRSHLVALASTDQLLPTGETDTKGE
jgi:Tfp pilus assembly protein PilF